MAFDANVPSKHSAGLSQCEDFMQFENALRESRAIDDKILYALNNSIPTASFQGQVDPKEKCKGLWLNIESVYSRREDAIKKCVAFNEAKIERQRQQQQADRSKIRAAQTTLRMLTNELLVEDVVRKRTHKAFHEKCRDHFKPPPPSTSSSS